MKNGTYKLAWILRDVAMSLKASGDFSATTIRCAINDQLDSWHRDGFQVRFNYNQDKAVAKVKELLRQL